MSMTTPLSCKRLERFWVQTANLTLVSVGSVSEALSKLSFGKFDVILSDYQMPQKTGLDFLTELRNAVAL